MKEKIEKSGIEFTMEYDGGKLRISYPLDFFADIEGSLENTSRFFPGEKFSEEYAMKAVDMLVFITVFDWIREFPMEPMLRVLGTSTTGFTWSVKRLEAARLVNIDRSMTNKESKKPYQWYSNVDRIETEDYDYAALTLSEYDVNGTDYGKMLDRYIESLTNPVFVPRRIERKFAEYEERVPDSLPYKSDYGLLTYRYSSTDVKDKLFEAYYVDTCVSNFGKEPVYKSGRIFNSFHFLPKSLRHNVEYNGSPLVELYDIHCAFYTLSVGMILEKGFDVDISLLEKFYDMCVSGELYDDLASHLSCTRDEAKEKLQGWRNCWRYGALHFDKFGYSEVSDYMEKNWFDIAMVYYNWPKSRNKDNKIVKNLQYDACVFETNTISKLAAWMHNEYGITCFCLHDAIYVSEAEKSQLPVNIDRKIAAWFKRELITKYKK